MASDEAFSWTTAFVIMILFSILGVVTRILGVDPFTLEFEASILYLPTIVLVLIATMTRQRGRVTSPAES
ncbi:MAG TPA: hypothetical protein VFE98_10485 [Candidatus Bathyarchaeia archaeon]|nr:hypothetical protein [Candidatus Bathyarchaeia archaeon]